MLQTVTRPDKLQVHFTYDALGRRLSKTFKNTTTKWLWDGNVPLHEWKENQNGDILSNSTVGDNGIVTWVFEENSFIPTAKLKNNKEYSIISDHLGTPIKAYSNEGDLVWERELDAFGKTKMLVGDKGFCNYLYQGQSLDEETGLVYNRFRYYDPEDGRYISVDPIGLFSGTMNFYSYVKNPNSWIDVYGLSGITIAELLKNEPDLLQEFRNEFKNNPEWQGIDPDSTNIQYVDKDSVDEIRKKKGESGGHHPHGLALDGPEGQTLTITNETRKKKNPKHSKATGMQRKLINRLKKAGYKK